MNKNIILALILVLYVNTEVIPFDNNAVEKIFQNKQPAIFLFTNGNDASTAAQ
jgi:hypothetical protein